MKNITLSADEGLIEAARERARAEHTTLNEQFRLWLADYARREQQAERAMDDDPGVAWQAPRRTKVEPGRDE